MDDKGANKNDEMYSHLDDIDEFFLKNFNILLTEKKDIQEKQVEILDIDDKKNNIVEILDEQVFEKENMSSKEILDIKDEEKIEILNIDSLPNMEILDDLNNQIINDTSNENNNAPNKGEILNIEEETLENNQEKADILEFKPLDDSENHTYYIRENEEENIFNNIDPNNYQNVTYYKKKIKPKKNKQKIILFILLILILMLLSFVIIKLIKWKIDNDDIKNQLQNIQNSVVKEEISDNESSTNASSDNNISNSKVDDVYLNVPLISVDIANLKKQNSDTIGWLKVNGTNIDYPVVQASDNEYYLTHAFNHNYNEAGWVFADYRNNLVDDKNLVIYGHARLNSTMFGTLKNVVKPFWYNDINNYVINFSMYDYNTLWLVFSTYIADNEKYYIKTSFSSDDEYMNFLNTIKSRSIYNYNIDINENDRIMTLSTCYTNDKRIVLHAKLIKREKR